MEKSLEEVTGEVVLTGDRPTGKLHLGHYVGSLRARAVLQEKNTQYILIADAQGLTDNADNIKKLRDNIYEVALDYLSVGIDPKKSTIFLQTLVPELTELTVYLMNFTTVSRVERNPTVKDEIAQKGFEQSVPLGFFIYPVSQAADILGFQATLVPVGGDQRPMIELSNDIVDRFQYLYNSQALRHVKGHYGVIERLPGIDGQAKMSKSLNNCVFLSDSADQIKHRVKMMFTDPGHLRVEDPGKVEGNVVFAYLDAFDPEKEKVEELKAHYRRGGLGDGVVKARLIEVLNTFLEPIRKRRAEYASDLGEVRNMILQGSQRASEVVANTISEMKEAMGVKNFLDIP